MTRDGMDRPERRPRWREPSSAWQLRRPVISTVPYLTVRIKANGHKQREFTRREDVTPLHWVEIAFGRHTSEVLVLREGIVEDLHGDPNDC